MYPGHFIFSIHVQQGASSSSRSSDTSRKVRGTLGLCLETPVLVFFCVDVVVDDDRRALSRIALHVLFLMQEKRMNLRGMFFRDIIAVEIGGRKKNAGYIVWPLGGQ